MTEEQKAREARADEHAKREYQDEQVRDLAYLSHIAGGEEERAAMEPRIAALKGDVDFERRRVDRLMKMLNEAEEKVRVLREALEYYAKELCPADAPSDKRAVQALREAGEGANDA